jgi:hypothetical protein
MPAKNTVTYKWLVWRINVGSGSDESIYWSLTSCNYKWWYHCYCFHTTKHSTLEVPSLLSQLNNGYSIFTSRFLTTVTIKVLLNYTLPMSLYYSTCKVTHSAFLATLLLPWNFGTQPPVLQSNLVSEWVILRPTVSRLVYLGIRPPSGAFDQIFY